jgi:hypothetical protein
MSTRGNVLVPTLLSPESDALRRAVAAYLARFKGPSRLHAECDLRNYLSWCRSYDLDPLAAQRPHLELYIRWMQEARRYKPSTVSRRIAVVAGFYRTCVIDAVLSHSPAEHVRLPPAHRVTHPRPDASAVRGHAHHRPHLDQRERLRARAVTRDCGACDVFAADRKDRDRPSVRVNADPCRPNGRDVFASAERRRGRTRQERRGSHLGSPAASARPWAEQHGDNFAQDEPPWVVRHRNSTSSIAAVRSVVPMSDGG